MSNVKYDIHWTYLIKNILSEIKAISNYVNKN